MGTEALEILLLRGAPGVGKSSLCRLLAKSPVCGAVIDLDDLWCGFGAYNNALRYAVSVAHRIARSKYLCAVIAAPFDVLAFAPAVELASAGGYRVGSIALFCKPEVLTHRILTRDRPGFSDVRVSLKVNADMMSASNGYDTTDRTPATVALHVESVIGRMQACPAPFGLPSL